MLARFLAVLGALAAALALAAPAFAVRVHVRVEGAGATLFGATEPVVRPVTGTFAPPDGVALTVPAATPLGALERASRLGEIYYRVQSSSFGPYVDRIGRRGAAGTTGWVYKVNGVSPPVGADKYVLRAGDRVLWYLARFGPAGGPRTLDLVRAGRRCFRAYSVDDNGRRERARDVVFRLDGRRIARAGGRFCPDGHWHSLRATKAGAVRSEVVVGPRRVARAAHRAE